MIFKKKCDFFHTISPKYYHMKYKGLPYRTPTIGKKIFEEFSLEFWVFIESNRIDATWRRRIWLYRYNKKWVKVCLKLKGINPHFFRKFWKDKLKKRDTGEIEMRKNLKSFPQWEAKVNGIEKSKDQ